MRSLANPVADTVRELLPLAELVEGDLQDLRSLIKAAEGIQPDETYNLGALSSVSRSWSQPELTAEITGLGAADPRGHPSHRAAFHNPLQPGLQFRDVRPGTDVAAEREHAFAPIHPYAIAKVFANHTTANFRQAHGLYAVCGILFNHESPRRGEEFVTRKITRGVARMALGRQDRLALDNSMSAETGDMRPSTSKRCGRCSSSPNPMTS